MTWRAFGVKEANEYWEDIYVGYRWFETFGKDKVLYPFGYGLSYTQFAYSNLAIAKKGDAYSVTFDIKNVGERDGEEVAQLYIHDQEPSPAGV